MQEFWNTRYSEEGFAYGSEPNAFFKESLTSILPAGKLLLPAEGEGRNAVYAAHLGWEVTAFDFSIAGKKKATALARSQGVQVNYIHAGVEEVNFQPAYFEAMALIYAHFHGEARAAYHKKLLNTLKKGGKIIFEAYAKEQVINQAKYGSGGPKEETLLFSLDEVKKEFTGLQFEKLEQLNLSVQEGKYHTGPAALIRFTGTKI